MVQILGNGQKGKKNAWADLTQILEPSKRLVNYTDSFLKPLGRIWPAACLVLQ